MFQQQRSNVRKMHRLIVTATCVDDEALTAKTELFL